MTKQAVNTSEAPAAIGPYSQGVAADGVLYISGQLPIDPETGAFPSDCVTCQAHQSLDNIAAILKEAGSDMGHVVKTTVYLDSMDDFAAVNEVYAEYFHEPYPARAAFEVARLPKGAKVEIEAVAKL